LVVVAPTAMQTPPGLQDTAANVATDDPEGSGVVSSPQRWPSQAADVGAMLL
jgi:hypothetical protein